MTRTSTESLSEGGDNDSSVTVMNRKAQLSQRNRAMHGLCYSEMSLRTKSHKKLPSCYIIIIIIITRLMTHVKVIHRVKNRKNHYRVFIHFFLNFLLFSILTMIESEGLWTNTLC